ncbi:ATP/GTP-binding protein [Mycobacterium sp. MFM001]|uniref:ATP-binding protein n=1 Tax=Mycobacterium sp. MFM001 TaxID=2049453 RepID=UPI000DA55283|nr:ATP-binding protein [Mycobacterium sp. MFM001]GBE67786.1 ATP/GTP-binding protein [Mycobacterium sp. MFM001]
MPPRVDRSFDPPQKVIGNLRYTRTGVYADYLIHGLPLTMRPLPVWERGARLTRNLGRNLPSGSQLFGLLACEDQDRILSNILGRHDDKPAWVSHCRRWEPMVADPLQTGHHTGPQQRVHWLTIPVDSGRLGRTVTGKAEKLGKWIIGRDPDSEASVAAYTQLAHEIIAALPDEFHTTAATPAQIRWHHRHIALRGVFTAPLPHPFEGPHTLPGSAFGRWHFDEGANLDRQLRWWPSRHSVVRIQELDEHANLVGPVSYQAMLAVDQFPARGVRFPKAAYLRALDNVDTLATIDWVQHLNLRTPDQALAANRRNAKNIEDQQRQRAAKRDAADAEDLANKLDATLDYSSELNANPTERELDGTPVIAVGAASIEVIEDAVKQIRQELDSVAIAFSRRRGSHRALWKAFNPGSETTSPLDEYRNPTTAHRWARFMPLTSDECGNSTGSPLAVNQNTMRPRIILHDPEGTARRNHNTGLGIVGEPGGGKSNRAKLSAAELALRGAQVRVFDPGKHAEWAKALRTIPDAHAFDPTQADISLDPLVIFPDEEAASKAADHILPLIGVNPLSVMRAQFEVALRPDNRERNGIRRMRDLIEYLRAQPNPHDNELLLRLEAAAASHYTQALFDPHRKPYLTADSQVTIWLTRNLALPDADDIRAAVNGGLDLQPRQLAAMAIYGLLVDLEQQQLFARPDQFGTIIFEECAELLAYPPGARAAHRVTTQGRKHNTGIWLITQDFHHLQRMGSEFITQKWLFRITNETLAEQTLEWAGIDPELYPDVVQSYVEDTSPANTSLTAGDEDEIGYVEPHRRGEGFIVDEFRRHARAKFFGAPTPQLAADLDSTPPVAA